MRWLIACTAWTGLFFGAAAMVFGPGTLLGDRAAAEGQRSEVHKSDLLTQYRKRTTDQLIEYLKSVKKGDLLQLTNETPHKVEKPATDGTVIASDDLLLDDSEKAKDELLLDDTEEQKDELLADDTDGSGDDLLLDDASDSKDELLAGDDDDDTDTLLLEETASKTEEPSVEDTDDGSTLTAAEEHARLFVESKYPSANTCSGCHPKHYEEWAISSHSYAQLSPVYMAMQITINMKTSSTTGDFCIRCHNQVGMNLNESIYMSNLDRSPTSREGITCVVCHRVNQDYGKVSGRIALEQGDLFSTVYGPTGNAELNRVINTPADYQVSTAPGKRGISIHAKAKKFFALTKPNFCGTCHDVTLPNGFRLEEAFAEWQRSPAAKRGVTCQDCHMGLVQGKKSGYQWGPAAMVDDVATRNRKLTNHVFSGPDYSIIHPGIFPHSVKAADLATPRQWLQFNYRAGWGTNAFEDAISENHRFPKHWQVADRRYDARKIIEKQFKRLAEARRLRLQVLRNGFKLGEINVTGADRRGLSFDIDVSNGTDGHGVPTGFDAERLIFLQVTVTDPNGKVVYKSGDRDPNGDVRDTHSRYVHNGELDLDDDLFNLQSKFIVRQVRGGEREQILAVNTSAAALPFVRPDRRAAIIYGRPRGARKHKQTIGPLASRTASYDVDADELTVNGTYKVKVKLIAQMVPVNLIGAIMMAGFDYGMSPKGIADRVVAGAATVWTRTTKVRIDGLQ